MKVKATLISTFHLKERNAFLKSISQAETKITLQLNFQLYERNVFHSRKPWRETKPIWFLIIRRSNMLPQNPKTNKSSIHSSSLGNLNPKPLLPLELPISSELYWNSHKFKQVSNEWWSNWASLCWISVHAWQIRQNWIIWQIQFRNDWFWKLWVEFMTLIMSDALDTHEWFIEKMMLIPILQ